MLVLTRKVEQKIRIGKNIVITILKVQGEQVSVGIDAPRSIPIAREELLARETDTDEDTLSIDEKIYPLKEPL